MLKNFFNDDKLFESVYNEGCGGPGTGGCGANKLTCGGGSGCGFRESRKLHECGSSGYSYSGSSCGGSYSSDVHLGSGCGAGGDMSYRFCKVGRRVRISVGSGCGSHIEVGNLLGYADD